MTAAEFKQRLAAGDRLAVVMNAMWEDDTRGFTAKLALQAEDIREAYASHAAAILAALASAEAKRNYETGLTIPKNLTTLPA